MVSVAVHDGSFHADDVFAVAILSLIYEDLDIVRTREETIYSKCDIVCDLGRKYDSKLNIFDHHQKGGAGVRDNEIPYASAGLVWKHFGKKLVLNEDSFKYVDERLIQEVDAYDNGVNVIESAKIPIFEVSDVISSFLPSWKEENPDYNSCFLEAVEFAKDLLKRVIVKANSLSEAKNFVLDAIKNSESEHYFVLEKHCPWKKTAINFSEAMFVVYPTNTGKWYAQSIPERIDSFDSRLYFPKSWAGKDNEDFSEASGIPDGIFCHRSRFICGAESKKSAIELVKKALKEENILI